MFSAALLRWNVYTIKFTQSVQFNVLFCFVLVFSQSCATITTIDFRTFHHPQRNPLSISYYFPWPSVPRLWKPLICFLSLDLPIMELSHIWNLNTWPLMCAFLNLATCFQGLSMLKHLSLHHSFLLQNNIPLYRVTTLHSSIHQLMSICLWCEKEVQRHPVVCGHSLSWQHLSKKKYAKDFLLISSSTPP